MIHITLVCSAGMSTSMLVAKMKEAAKSDGIDINIVAMSESSFATYNEKTDVLLVGPQISYLESHLRATYEPKGIKVGVINMQDYGLMNGKAVLDWALGLTKE